MKKFDIFLPQRQYDIFLQKKIPAAEIFIQTLPVRLTMSGKHGNQLALASCLDGELIHRLLHGDIPFQILASTAEANLYIYDTAQTSFAFQAEAEPIVYLTSTAKTSDIGVMSQPASLVFACYMNVHDMLGFQTYAAESRVSPSLCPSPTEIGFQTSAAVAVGVELFETLDGGFAVKSEAEPVLVLMGDPPLEKIGVDSCADALVVRFRRLYELDNIPLEDLDGMTLKDLDYITT